MAYEREIDEDFIARTAFAVSKTGEKISNQLDYADWNYFQPGEVTYLSRSDWEATYPKKYDAMTLTSQDMIDYTNGKYYTIQTDDDTSAIKWGVDNSLMFYEMFDKDFDDESWQILLDKMTLEEATVRGNLRRSKYPGSQLHRNRGDLHDRECRKRYCRELKRIQGYGSSVDHLSG